MISSLSTNHFNIITSDQIKKFNLIEICKCPSSKINYFYNAFIPPYNYEYFDIRNYDSYWMDCITKI